jgi:hypothetical protein
VPDDDYLTPAEFAALTTAQQIAVWQAHAAGRVQAVRWNPRQTNSVLMYRRADVNAVLGETAVTG